MGHSDAWRDTEWLAEQILTWLFAEERPSETIHFSLLGSHQGVTLLVGPLGSGKGDRSLAFTFSVTQGYGAHDSGPSDSASVLQRMLHADRYLMVLQRVNGARFQKPQTLRGPTRKMLASAKELKEGQACPTLAQHLPLLVGKHTTAEDLTLQLVVVFSQWGLVEITEDDFQAFVKYLSSMWTYPDKFVHAAEEAISFIFLRWVLPEDWRAFKLYARKIVWVRYVQAVRALAETMHSSSRGAFRPREDWAEQKVERTKRGQKAAETPRDHISVSELASISKVFQQRIYETIKANKLKAVKMGMSLRLEASAATEFYNQARQKREIQNLKDQLLAGGITKEALRKRIYRHGIKPGSDTDIGNFLRCVLKNLRSCKSDGR